MPIVRGASVHVGVSARSSRSQRAERRRQVDLDQIGRRAGAEILRSGVPRRRRGDGHASPRDDPPRLRLSAADRECLCRHVGRRQSSPRGSHPPAWRAAREDRRDSGILPCPRRAAWPARRPAVGRRAPDARDRPRPHGAAEASSPRRGFRWALAEDGRNGIRRTLEDPRHLGVTILIVEQNVRAALAISDRAYVLAEGVNRHEGTAADLRDDPTIAALYLGARRETRQ